MTIHLSEDLRRFVRDRVESGRYPSEDDVIRDALEQLRRHTPAPQAASGLGSIGAMREAADELDEIVAHAMKRRLGEPWRPVSVE